MKSSLTAERLRELLEYAPETGLFYWRKHRGGVAAGQGAGSAHSGGYRLIVIDGIHHYAHRLAWLHVHGEDPKQEIDHINGIRTDNRIANLRQCSRRENARNKRRQNSRFKGVVLRPASGKWCAQIGLNGRSVYLGIYDTAEAAAAAYDAAARRHFQDFARTNAASSETERPAPR